MTELFNSFDNILTQAAPKIANRLQPGLTIDRIEAQIAGYSWTFPPAAFDLYHWHNAGWISCRQRNYWRSNRMSRYLIDGSQKGPQK